MTAEPEITRWYLYCGEEYIHSTDDPDLARQWVDSDPNEHEARSTR